MTFSTLVLALLFWPFFDFSFRFRFFFLALFCGLQEVSFFPTQTRRAPSQSWSSDLISSSSKSSKPQTSKEEFWSGSISSASSSICPFTCLRSECRWRWFFCRKVLPHNEHRNGLSPVCMRQCAFRWSGRLNAFWQMSHLYGLSWHGTLRCLSREDCRR